MAAIAVSHRVLAAVVLMDADARDELDRGSRGRSRRALDEDLRYGPDVTTLATVPADAITTASMVTREPGVVAGRRRRAAGARRGARRRRLPGDSTASTTATGCGRATRC